MYSRFVKRALDLVFALLLMPFVILSFVAIAPIIYLEDHGSIFYMAPRRGYKGSIFKIIKYRSMYMNAPVLKNQDGSTYSGNNDPRVTKIGRLIRKLSIDELPQIINVLKGDMSFVGPRPNLATGDYNQFDEIRKKRLEVLPGITGYSQAYFRNSITQDQKFINDCYYVDNISFALDFKIVLQTVISVLGAKNINYQESANKKDEKIIKENIH